MLLRGPCASPPVKRRSLVTAATPVAGGLPGSTSPPHPGSAAPAGANAASPGVLPVGPAAAAAVAAAAAAGVPAPLLDEDLYDVLQVRAHVVNRHPKP